MTRVINNATSSYSVLMVSREEWTMMAVTGARVMTLVMRSSAQMRLSAA